MKVFYLTNSNCLGSRRFSQIKTLIYENLREQKSPQNFRLTGFFLQVKINYSLTKRVFATVPLSAFFTIMIYVPFAKVATSSVITLLPPIRSAL